METFIKQITKEAGDAILKKFGKIGVKYAKKDATDVVTEADLVANKIITSAIEKKYTAHAIISEETGEHQIGAEYCWIIDPLDGTRNFSTGTPMFGVMIGLVINGELELATIYNPCTNELFFAKKGKGAFLNDKKIHCSEHKKWQHSWGLINSHMSEKNRANLQKILAGSIKEPVWLSSFGCIAASTMYLANGRRDWGVSQGGNLWDYASPVLILREAGCIVTNLKGEPWSMKDKEFLVANKYIHPRLVKIINSK